ISSIIELYNKIINNTYSWIGRYYQKRKQWLSLNSSEISSASIKISYSTTVPIANPTRDRIISLNLNKNGMNLVRKLMLQ
ncbi:MAG: hypothetical protein WBE68_14925, partial [Candidatus Nitrosopolaris sp.]